MIVFHPSESWQALCVNEVEANPCLVLILGIDYMSREIENYMLLVEHHSRESEMSNEEFKRRLWREDQLRPVSSGCVFVAQTDRTGYVHRDVG